MTPKAPRRGARFAGASILIVALVAVVAVTGIILGRAGQRPPPPLLPGAVPSAFPTPPGGRQAGDPAASVLLGAGDIARCDVDADEATARLLDLLEGTVFTAGDNVYDRGTAQEFERCYGPTWGRHRERTRFPAPGDHDWETAGAAGYLGYFGQVANPDGRTWYSDDIGAWHVVVLDTNCERVGGCDEGSPQLRWLRADLEGSDARCTVVIAHHPRFSSGQHGGYQLMAAIWREMHRGGVEVVVSGDDHNYERFAPQDAEGTVDEARGVRQFVVGTGGTHLRPMADVRANSEVRSDDTHGVLRLELGRAGYSWAFVPIAGATFSDNGTGACH